MKSKTSFFNKGIFFHDLKGFSWISIAYFTTLFLTVPLKILMNYNIETALDKDYLLKGIFTFRDEFQIFLILIVPVLTAIFLFRYLHTKKAGDLFHCLPIKREKMYDHHVLMGICILMLPLVVIGIISVILNYTLDLSKFYTIKDVLKWLGLTSLMNITMFISSVFVAMNTGIATAQGILTYIFLFLPVGITGLLVTNLESFIYGMSSNYYLSQNIELLSPLVRISDLRNTLAYNTGRPITTNEVMIYIVFCFILYFISKYLYKIRNVETYSKAVVFSKLEPVFKYGVTLCTMLVAGIYFRETNGNIGWILFGYFIGSLIGYFIAQMILKKSIYVFKDIKGYILYMCIMVVVLLGVKLDVIGYEKYTPSVESIKSVYFGQGFYDYNEEYDEKAKERKKLYFEKENIEKIIKLQKEIIKNRPSKENTYEASMSFVYELENGKKIARNYVIPRGDYKAYLKPIYESMEHKKINYDLLHVNSSKTSKITIFPNEVSNKRLNLILPDEINTALSLLKEDIENKSYEEMIDTTGYSSDVEIMLYDKKESVHVNIDKTYPKFEAWLKEKGYLKNARMMPEDIKYVAVEERENSNSYDIDENKSDKRLEITDKNQIEFLLRNYSRGNEKDGKYILCFYLENGNKLDVFMDNNRIPEFINQYFLRSN